MNNIRQEGAIVPEAPLEERVINLKRLVNMLLQRMDVSIRNKDWWRTSLRDYGSKEFVSARWTSGKWIDSPNLTSYRRPSVETLVS